jgi:hypothetical protein
MNLGGLFLMLGDREIHLQLAAAPSLVMRTKASPKKIQIKA